MKTKTYADFAHAVGKMARQTRDASAHWHKEFLGMEAEEQGEMRVEWIQNHLIGQGYSAKRAEVIRTASRIDRNTDEQRAYDKARGDFAYHIQRPTKSNKAEAKTPRIAATERAAWEKFVSIVGADRAKLIAKTLG